MSFLALRDTAFTKADTIKKLEGELIHHQALFSKAISELPLCQEQCLSLFKEKETLAMRVQSVTAALRSVLSSDAEKTSAQALLSLSSTPAPSLSAATASIPDLIPAFRYADAISPRSSPEHQAILQHQIELTLFTLVLELKNKETCHLTLTKACEDLRATMVKTEEVIQTLKKQLAALKD